MQRFHRLHSHRPSSNDVRDAPAGGSRSGCARGGRAHRCASRATGDVNARRCRRRCRRRYECARDMVTEVWFVVFRCFDGRLGTITTTTTVVVGVMNAIVCRRLCLRRRSSSSLGRLNDDRCAGRSARANAARATASSRALGAKAEDGRTFHRVGKSCRKESGRSGVRIVEGAGGARAWIVSGMGRIASPSGFGCSERRRISLDLFF